LELELEVPTSAGTHKCATALWEFFWQGYRYSEKVATTTAFGSGSLAGSGTGQRNPKISKAETFNGERDKFADFVVQLHIVFNANKAGFANDKAKISYTCHLLFSEPPPSTPQPHN
jgi:hypothetical protein